MQIEIQHVRTRLFTSMLVERRMRGSWVQDLREWVEYHKNLGVTRFYIMDSNSSKSWGREIADYISSGLVDFFYRCPPKEALWPLMH